MLSTNTRLKIQDILERVAKGKEVTISERIYVQKFADRDQTVSGWLNKARHLQHKNQESDGIDNLLGDLSLGSPDPDSFYLRDDDLGDWFSGAPSWLGRS